ncbi:MAG: histidine kinase [Candidatus Nitrosocosmicus sp.]
MVIGNIRPFRRYRLFIIVISFGFPLLLKGQTLNSFNYNIDNGLPSNYIYSVLTDRLGYLWLATKNGVATYNGYEFKIYNQSDGISNEDIWELCEDKKGRMWLSNISEELGYVYNNKYYKVLSKEINHIIYPRDTRSFGNGIIFCSRHIGVDWGLYVCFVNDSIFRKFNITGAFQEELNQPTRHQHILFATIDEYGQPIIDFDDKFYKVLIGDKTFSLKFLCKAREASKYTRDNKYILLNNYLLFYPYTIKPHKFHIIKLKDGTMQEVDLEKIPTHETINYIYTDLYGKKHLYLTGENDLFEFKCDDTGVRLLNTFKLKSLIDDPHVKNNKITSIHEDFFWGSCITTTTKGLWLKYNLTNHFKKEKRINLDNYSYVGGIDDSLSFWWCDLSHSLIKVTADRVQYYKQDINYVSSIVPIAYNTFLVNSIHSYFFNDKTGKVIKDNNMPTHIRATLFNTSRSFYSLTTDEFIYVDEGQIIKLDHERYRDIVYDSLRQVCWAYNFDKACIHGKSIKRIIQKKDLLRFGVEQIEKIAVDNKYGNLFFKGSNNITVYNYESNTYKELFKNFNLKETSFLIHNSTFIVFGRMGILFSKILKRDSLSAPLFYPNLKNKNFNFVYDCVVLGNKLLLNTDRGSYSVCIPSDSEIIKAKNDSLLYRYKYVISYGDTIQNFTSCDTIIVNQKDQRLQFDVINPFGNGRIKYAYKLSADKSWHELNTNELTLPPSLKPDQYYTLLLRTYDNVWKNSPVLLYIYIRPFWYQTSIGLRFIELIALLLILTFISFVILITRRSVVKSMQKRNLKMELELKSIYAQLNPHFVFNTLTSALNLITKEKFEDAQLYISKFAKLLRSYLNSSRNRFTTLSHELNNIKNYIEIQQLRFPDLFTYEIIISDKIFDPDKIIIPSLLLQPIVENAIHHGILPKERDGHLKIVINAEANNEITCIIEDNGIGRKRSALNKSISLKNESHGTNLINELIDIFNRYEKVKIEINYLDKEEPLTGTIVQLKIKKDHYEKI